ncbi:hypothetical protein IEE94_11105 [Yimella sp. cx-573]|nr:hypothetical protein [Yimella sp. cx-573]
MTSHPADWRCYSRGCRQDPCRNAWRIYQKRHRLAIETGHKQLGHMVPTAPVRAFLADWKRQGIGVNAISKATGVAKSTLYRATTQDTIRSTTADQIMSFRPRLDDLADRVRIDGTGTRRRLQALGAIGWTWAAIGRELGCSGQNIRAIVEQVEARESGLVTAATARTIRDFYDQAWQAPPPADSGYQVGEQARARRRAQERGWPPPMAWDDDTIDDPGVYASTSATRADARGRPAEHIADDVAFLLDTDPHMTSREIAQRLSYRDQSAVQVALKRAGRTDLLERLATNAAHRAA